MARQRGVSRKKPAPEKEQKAPKKAAIVAKKPDPPKEERIILNPETGEEEVVSKYATYPQGIRYVAKMMYISGQAKPADIARRLDIPIGTIRSWQTRDRWTFLKRQVTRLANKDAVKAARRSMSKYVRDIDRGLNTILERLNDRLPMVKQEDQLSDEKSILQLILEVWRLKLALFRSLTYGTQGKVFYPHPTNLRFDGTEDDKTTLFGQNELDKIIDTIPEYLKEAAKFVIGMSPEDIDEEVYDALVIYLDDLEEHREQDKKERKRLRSDDEDDDLILGLDPVEELLEDDEED